MLIPKSKIQPPFKIGLTVTTFKRYGNTISLREDFKFEKAEWIFC